MTRSHEFVNSMAILGDRRGRWRWPCSKGRLRIVSDKQHDRWNNNRYKQNADKANSRNMKKPSPIHTDPFRLPPKCFAVDPQRTHYWPRSCLFAVLCGGISYARREEMKHSRAEHRRFADNTDNHSLSGLVSYLLRGAFTGWGSARTPSGRCAARAPPSPRAGSLALAP